MTQIALLNQDLKHDVTCRGKVSPPLSEIEILYGLKPITFIKSKF